MRAGTSGDVWPAHKPKRLTDREVGAQSHGAPEGACQAAEVCSLVWEIAMSACASLLAFFLGASPKWRDSLDALPFWTNISTYLAICLGPAGMAFARAGVSSPNRPGADSVRHRIGDRP